MIQQFARIDTTPEDDYDNYGDYDPSLKTDTIVFDYIEDGQDGVSNTDSTGDLVANLGPMASKVFDKLCLGKLKLEFSDSIHSVKYVLFMILSNSNDSPMSLSIFENILAPCA